MTSELCPRCGDKLFEEGFYGPCESCRAELRATMRSDAKQVAVEAFKPTMHVTVGAVALPQSDA